MKQRSILSSTLQVTAAMLLIKLLGVLKQSLIAAICGATAETDAYFVATGVIIALCSVIFSSLSISLLSIHTERLVTEGREASNNLINAVLRVFIPIAIAIAVLTVVFSHGVAKILAPSYEGEQLRLLAEYIRLMSAMFVFTCYYLIINVVLETDKRFLPGKGQNFLQNLFICIAAVTCYGKFGMSALIYAFLLAGAVQCIQITWNARKEFHFCRTVRPEKETIQKLLTLTVPLLIGNAIYEINDIVDKQIATGLGHGNVSFLSYGASINEIVTTLIISSVSTVMFSHYATWAAEGEYDRIKSNLERSIEYLVVLILPVMVICFVCGDTVVDVLYGRGNFDGQAISSTAGVVFGYACGFLFQAMRANLVRVYYAFQDTKTPMINGAISVAINVVLSILLSKVMGVGGIAAATSIAMLIVTILLIPGTKKYIKGFSVMKRVSEYGKAIGAATIVCLAAYWLRSILHTGSFVTLVTIVAFTVAGYLAVTCLMRVQAVDKIMNEGIHMLRTRLKRTK